MQYFYTKEVYINLNREDIDMVIGKLEEIFLEDLDADEIYNVEAPETEWELTRINLGDINNYDDYTKVVETLKPIFEGLDFEGLDYIQMRNVGNKVRIKWK